MSGKVSLITPCYNGQKYTKMYIDNISKQDYPLVEVIFVNDGSTDDVEAIVSQIKEVVKEKGYEFIYLSQENGGIASAVNWGLQYVTGDYLMLLDMDDELYEKAISAKAEYLNVHTETDVVISNGYYVFENKKRQSCPFVNGNKVVPEEIFERLLGIDFYTWPGSYMVRCDRLFEMNGGRDIFQSPYGQNLQILLPVTYQKKVAFLDQYLMNYYVRKHSASHTEDPDKMVKQVMGYEEIRKTVVRRICHDKQEEEYYIRMIEVAGSREKLRYACRTRNQAEMNRQYKRLKDLEAVIFSDKLVYFCGKNIVFTMVYKTIYYMIVKFTNKVI